MKKNTEEKRELTLDYIDEVMNKTIEQRLLNRADWNSAIRIKNTNNFFNAEKGIYSVKFDSKNNIWYYILRPHGRKEPTIREMNAIMDNNTNDNNYLFLASETKFDHRHVLGQIITKYEL